ncbi:hypothetical protein OSB04_025154 [Centaurea solstitialis]|uniref:Retrotransposon gag domain-containing protein n=1 Tax=Centaurea solstitialis TaxID=347529 RepID=A0AA38W3S8_9ASTR|nr:hypothetical protein OSB04_025154 [Centaurea solstitialis]
MPAPNRGVQAPGVGAHNFEIRHGTIQLLQQNQFGGAPTEDPHGHLRTFERICNTFKINGVTDDALKLRLFGFSLKGRAQTWEENLPSNQITTWAQMTTAFLDKFFPPGRTTQLMADITHFAQWDQETLYEAWERYKDMLKKCPHHGLQDWVIIQTFFGGLHPQYKNEITAAAGGALMNKTYEEAVELIENLAEHSYATPRSATRRVASVHESDELKEIKAQLAAITNQLKGTSIQPDEAIPDLFPASQEPEQSGNFSNSSSSSNVNNVYRPPGYNQRRADEGQATDKKPGLEDTMMKFMAKMDGAVGGLAATVGVVKTATEQNTAAIHILERQVGQIAEALQARALGQFPSQTKKKPREECKAIYLRSGKVLIRDPTRKPVVEETEMEGTKAYHVDVNEIEVEDEIPLKEPKNDAKGNEKEKTAKPMVNATVPKVPFSSRLKAHKDDVNFAKFLEIFKKLHINIPFADALAQIPSYVRFLKDVLSNKRKIEEHATVALTEECSAIIQHKLPPKLKDPGSFTIPVHIGNSEFSKELCDLGASINLMPLSIFRKLGLGEVQPTNITLQLADRSINYPYGVIEDVLVKVDKFYFPVDFVVLDIDEDEEIPLILGRPFLSTGGALIDVKEGRLTLRVGEEKVVFNVFRAAKHSSRSDDCYQVNVVDSTSEETHSQQVFDNHLVKALTNDETDLEKEEVIQLNAFTTFKGFTSDSDQQLQQKVIVPTAQVLLINSQLPLFPGKLKPKWSRPFIVKDVSQFGMVELEGNDGTTFQVNGQWVKPYLGGETVVTDATFLHEPTE